MLIIAQIYVVPFPRNRVSFRESHLAQVRWWVTDPVFSLRITVIFISILISRPVREFLNDSWVFILYKAWSPEAASEIDMDMYVQFHGWLMEKRLIHMMMIFFVISKSVKREEWMEFISGQTRRLLNKRFDFGLLFSFSRHPNEIPIFETWIWLISNAH